MMNPYSGKDLGSLAFIDNMTKQSFPVKDKQNMIRLCVCVRETETETETERTSTHLI